MRYIINGPSNIAGNIRISGAKNFSIKALAAALLNEGVTTYHNLPNNLDVHKTCAMLRAIGANIEINDEISKKCSLNTNSVQNVLNTHENANMTVLLLAAALIHKFDFVQVPLPKGCPLGMRLDDFHIMAFNAFGVDCQKTDESYLLRRLNELKAAHIILPYPSVGATETALFLAMYAKGQTIIENAAIEPEVSALILLLVSMGAQIYSTGDRKIVVHGVDQVNVNVDVYVHGDLLEASSWACLAALCDGEITVNGIVPELIGSFLGIFNTLGGVTQRVGEDIVKFSKNSFHIKKHVTLETGVFPALRTDLQPILAALSCKTSQNLTIHETVYDNRIDYVDAFAKFGVETKSIAECVGEKCRFSDKYQHSAIISYAENLKAPKEKLHATTIRNGMAQILLACAATGETVIEEAELIERGYCSLLQKLRSVGVDIRKEF